MGLELGSNPRVSDYASVWDSDRDGLTDADEVADDNRNFKIDDAEKLDGAATPGPKGWEVVVTNMHPRTFDRNDICWENSGDGPVEVMEAKPDVWTGCLPAPVEIDLPTEPLDRR